MKRTVQAGTGITSFPLTIHDESLTAELFDQLYGGDHRFPAKVAQIEAVCRQIIDNPEPYIEEARRRGTHDEEGLRWKRDLPPDIAQRILRLLDLAKSAETVGHDMALRLAFDAGVATCELGMKLNREVEYLCGLKVRTSGKQNNRQKPDRDAKMAREYLSRLPNKHMSRTALIAKIGEAYGLKSRAARDAVKRGLKNIGQDPANCT